VLAALLEGHGTLAGGFPTPPEETEIELITVVASL